MYVNDFRINFSKDINITLIPHKKKHIKPLTSYTKKIINPISGKQKINFITSKLMRPIIFIILGLGISLYGFMHLIFVHIT